MQARTVEQGQEQPRLESNDWRIAMPALLRTTLDEKQESHAGAERPELTNIICGSFAYVSTPASLDFVDYKWEEQPDS